jgi:tetratricopeptide (TPR) repeat protein
MAKIPTSNFIESLHSICDFSNPSGTRSKLESLKNDKLPRTTNEILESIHIETQIARTLGLEKQFDNGLKLLNAQQLILEGISVPPIDAIENCLYLTAKIRIKLEKGRIFRSSNSMDLAKQEFAECWTLCQENNGHCVDLDYFYADTGHMLAIISNEPLEKSSWFEKTIAVAEASKDGRTRGWLGALYNNHAWDLFDSKEYAKALTCFKKALEARLEPSAHSKLDNIEVAKWSVARCLRALGEVQKALIIQLDLIKTRQEDGYVWEELAILHELTGNLASSIEAAKKGVELLGKDDWFVENEADRLKVLQDIANKQP